MGTAITLGPLAASLKGSAVWNDQYPAWQDFANELELLLAYLDRNGCNWREPSDNYKSGYSS
jgi:hypothetical protein